LIEDDAILVDDAGIPAMKFVFLRFFL